VNDGPHAGEPFVSTWVAPGDQAAVESLTVNALLAMGGRSSEGGRLSEGERRAESRDDVTFTGGVVLHMEAHVVPNAQRHPAMTAHVALTPGPTEITTTVTLSLSAIHGHEARTERFHSRCVEIATSVQEVTGSVPQT